MVYSYDQVHEKSMLAKGKVNFVIKGNHFYFDMYAFMEILSERSGHNQTSWAGKFYLTLVMRSEFFPTI